MASDYGLNFGFRRSDESVRVAEGRFRTPADGPALLLGTAVQINSGGYLAACEDSDPLITGYSGLLLQEEIWDRSIFESNILDSFSLGIAKLNRLSVITSGAGTKVWFKNTASQDRVDGRSIASVTIWDTTNVGVGDFLGWSGTQWEKNTTPAQQWMVVTAVDTTAEYVEAVLVR